MIRKKVRKQEPQNAVNFDLSERDPEPLKVIDLDKNPSRPGVMTAVAIVKKGRFWSALRLTIRGDRVVDATFTKWDRKIHTMAQAAIILGQAGREPSA